MNNSLFSDGFVNTKNLSAKTIEGHAKQFASHPLKLLQVQNFLSSSFANSCAQFLNNHANYDDVYGLYSPNGSNVSKQQWLSSARETHFYFYQMLTSTQFNKTLGINGLHFLKLRQLLSSNDFKQYIEKLTTTRLGSSTPIKVHRMQPQHFLNPHNDRQDLKDLRLIAFILYLSPQWDAESGGQLCIIDQDNNKNIIEPEFNNLLLFDVTQHQYHSVLPIISTQNKKKPNRLSINGWFYQPK